MLGGAGPSEALADDRACGAAPSPLAPAGPPSPAPNVQRGPGFALVRGAGGLADVGCAPPEIASAALADAVRRVQLSLQVDAQLAVILTTGAARCDAIYYIPLANDTRGIGYAHADPREVFDDTPGLALEGIAFLNDWPYWSQRQQELQSAFNHELGHRWGGRVRSRADAGGLELLGRGGDHWSYFLDTGGSPLEGNLWVAAEAGYESRTPEYPSEFSALDLYLMGVAEPHEVPPLRLLTQARAEGLDCALRPISASSPPQTCGDAFVQAELTDIGIDEIIQAEGPRVPAAAAEPKEVELVVLVIETPSSPLRGADCEQLALALTQRRAGFERATRGRLRLVDVLGEGGSCDGLSLDAEPPLSPSTPALPRAPSCALAGPSAARSPALWLLLACLCTGYRRREASNARAMR